MHVLKVSENVQESPIFESITDRQLLECFFLSSLAKACIYSQPLFMIGLNLQKNLGFFQSKLVSKHQNL